MDTDAPEEDVFDAISAEEARDILAAASREPNSAKDLEGQSDATLPTIYRHTERLCDTDLLHAETRIDPDGDHYETFETTVRRVSLVVERGEWSLDVDLRDDLADRFADLWRTLGQ